jgi:3-polyprenyl-4-hydroxybenzoate decarboxylase
MNVQAITYRRDAIYHDIHLGGRARIISAASRSKDRFTAPLNNRCPRSNVHLLSRAVAAFTPTSRSRKPPQGEKRSSPLRGRPPGQARRGGRRDINIFDDAEVLWAVATRSRWDRDLIVIPNMICTTRDPTAYAGSPGDLSYHAYTVAKGGIDATMPAPPEPFEIRIKVPDDVMRKVQIEDFVAKDPLSRIPPDA